MGLRISAKIERASDQLLQLLCVCSSDRLKLSNRTVIIATAHVLFTRTLNASAHEQAIEPRRPSPVVLRLLSSSYVTLRASLRKRRARLRRMTSA